MPRVLIAGGGIAGLTAALAFNQFGWDAVVLEQASAFEEIGAGLQISPNAMKVYQALGLEDELVSLGFLPEALELRHGRSGRRVFKIDLSDAKRRWGAPYLHLHRADLLKALENTIRKHAHIELRLNARIERYEHQTGGVVAYLEGGGYLNGDLLIGADGIHSKVRQQLIGSDKPNFTGNIAWRATVPMERLAGATPPATACVWAGPKRHAVTYRLRGGALANFVGVVERNTPTQETWTQTGPKSQALSDFDGWDPVILELIEKADTLHHWALYDRDPLPRWQDGHTVLIGDAAHPTLPFMAQGAAMGIEDAYFLAKLCTERRDALPAALTEFYTQRIDRTSAIQSGSRARAKTFHKSTPIGRLTTYTPMKLGGFLAPRAAKARQDWIFKYDVTG